MDADPPIPGHAARPHSRWAVLRHRHFRTIAAANFASNVGTWLEHVAIQWIVSQDTKSTVWMGYLALGQLAPCLILGILGGVVADRCNRKKLLLWTQFVMMLVAFALFVAAWYDHTDRYTLLVLAIVQGITMAFNMPAWQTLTPRIVPRDELPDAFIVQGILFNLSRIIGPALGGILMGTLGVKWLFAINALSFVGELVAIATTPDAPAPPEYKGRWLDWPLLKAQTFEAFAFVFKNPGPRAVFTASMMYALFCTPLVRFLPLLVTEVYHIPEGERGEQAYGYMLGMLGLGAVVGGLLLKHVPKWYPRHHLVPLSIFLGGLAILAYSAVTSIAFAVPAMFVVGIFWMWGFNSAWSAMQLLTPDHMRGRVLSVANTISVGLMPMGTLLAGWVGLTIAHAATRFDPSLSANSIEAQAAVAFPALLLVVFGLITLRWRTPEIDGLKPGDHGFERVPGLRRGITARTHHPRNSPPQPVPTRDPTPDLPQDHPVSAPDHQG